jgi:hypothetical protein
MNIGILVPCALLVTAVACQAADMTASTNAPAVDGADIANYGTSTGTDKWWTAGDSAGSAKGQTFTTGPLKVYLKAITYQVTPSQKAEPTKTYRIRVGSVFSNIFTELHTEDALQTFTWNGGEYMTWRFDTPVLLDANAIYGVDVTISESSTGWRTGIPYITMTGNAYGGGSRYTAAQAAGGTPPLGIDTSRDRIFHLDMEYLPHGFQISLE